MLLLRPTIANFNTLSDCRRKFDFFLEANCPRCRYGFFWRSGLAICEWRIQDLQSHDEQYCTANSDRTGVLQNGGRCRDSNFADQLPTPRRIRHPDRSRSSPTDIAVPMRSLIAVLQSVAGSVQYASGQSCHFILWCVRSR